MKHFFLIVTLAISSLTASAFVGDVVERMAGVQFVYGTEADMPGVGIHFKTQYLESWRTVVSGNYYFKKNGVSCYDVNLEGNYIFFVGEKIQLYPLVGGRAAIWHTDAVNSSGDNTQYKIGFNAGGGIDYLLGEHWGLNAEVKYQIISHASQVVFGIGASYRF